MDEIRPSPLILWDSVALLLVQMLLLYQLDQVDLERQERMQLQALKKETQLRMESTAQMLQAYESQRKLTHDFSNHLAVLEELLYQKKVEEASAYLQKLSGIRDTMHVVNTQDPILDALLNTKYAQARSRGVCINFKVGQLTAIPMDRKDMVTLLANLLDNAIEASEKTDGEKTILFKLVQTGAERMVLSVRNPSKQVEIVHGAIATDKQDAALHGFGLSNVKHILEQYHCPYTMHWKDGWFTFVAHLPSGLVPHKENGSDSCKAAFQAVTVHVGRKSGFFEKMFL